MEGRHLLRAGLLGLAALAVQGATLPKSGVVGTKHDIGGIGCKGCHAPHSGSIANGGTDGTTGRILLWARGFPAAANTFGVYDSATMKSKATELGGSALTTSSDVRMYSLLCLSCHDGVTSTFSPAMTTVNQVGSKAAFGGTAYESFGLTNDHPVNMNYNPTLNTTLQPIATATASVPLYGSGNTMQCGTCHDSHNNTNTRFLRVSMTSSALCLACHI